MDSIKRALPFLRLALVLPMLPLAAGAAPAVWLHELDLSHLQQSRGTPRLASVAQPLTIGGREFFHGVGTHADSAIWLDLGGGSDRFSASVGLDGTAKRGTAVVFRIFGDGRKLFDSGAMRPGQPAQSVSVELAGVKVLLLQAIGTDDDLPFGDADWADAQFVLSGRQPIPYELPREEAVVLTPKPGPAPRINGPEVYGCRPGHPFLYRIPTQGTRPMRFEAAGLPAGLTLDARTGFITGTAPAEGTYEVTLHAANSDGARVRHFKIVSGPTLALTPPMGWNDWYAHYDRITDQKVREAADVMLATGLADVGYQYVNIDDCWENAEKSRDPERIGPARDDQGNLIPNPHFPDMKALTDYLHARGFKAGIYSSPGPKTCGGFTASYQHEAQDAQQIAAWGFDFLKYDWCSYRFVLRPSADRTRRASEDESFSLEELQRPYRLMGRILQDQPRDIVFNLCQYGMGSVWEWGAAIGGQSWRTSGDLGFELNRIFAVALANAKHRQWSKPGSWNDPDYIQIGHVGSAAENGLPKPSSLTPTEQYSFMSLWSLMASPLFYSGDMGSLDEFTINVLANPEVIAVDQDPLGQCARVIHLGDDTFLMVKELADGSLAVGLCNRGEFPTRVDARWAQLAIHGKWTARDLWRQRDLGAFEGAFGSDVPRHGVVLVRLRPSDQAQ
jgi:alpha-galactosidase